ncbi:MAG: HD domain-containing protein [Ichthyobacteriaceae bacterium]|nr:HD domain-containing protein [Ichthyobacteriaceae bacterium]
MLKEILDTTIFKAINKATEELNLNSYVIGGFVRDYYLKRGNAKDIDIVAIGSGIELAKKVADILPGKIKVQVFKNFGTAMLNYNEVEVEFVGARKESYRADSRKPIVENGTLDDDQNRRDFTINAMAFGLNNDNFGELLDPFNGIDDLESKILRTPLDPDITYSDDPLRMMRAIRFATQLGFVIEQDSVDAIKRNNDRIKIISKERITTELNKIILSTKPSIGFEYLHKTGLLQHILPELLALQGVEEVEGQRHKDNFYHSVEVLDNISTETDDLWLRWSALLHDIGKAPTKRFDQKIGWTFHGHEFKGKKMVPAIFKRLKLPLGSDMRFVQKMIMMSSRPVIISEDIVTDSAVRRLLFDAGNEIESLMTLCEADITTKNPRRMKKYKNNFKLVRIKMEEVEEKDKVRNWQPPITGEMIMETFNLKPSKEVGDIKIAIREAILNGDILNNYDEAFAFMVEKGKEMGLTQV